MKRYASLLVLLFVSFALVAEEAVLIDFDLLKSDTELDDPYDQTKKIRQNKATLMDFADVSLAGSTLPTQQKDIMKSSLAPANWEIVLASSSKTVTNMALSYTTEAPIRAGASKYAGQTILGIRVHFPVEKFNSWAYIKPPFDIPAFEPADAGSAAAEAKLSKFEGSFKDGLQYANGVVKNVGVIKSIAVSTLGLNFPHSLSVVLKNENQEEKVINMGFLNFDGWRTMTWENPAYVKEVRNRELRIYPIYPKSTPFYKLAGFIIKRDAAHDGGDFIGYIKDVKMIYDLAVFTTERDINDEDIWGIIGDKEQARKAAEFQRFGDQQVNRYLEGLKKATETKFTDTDAKANP
jgi:hypothetical protein